MPSPLLNEKMITAIETDHLTKHYGRTAAVDQLSLRVAKGELYAFVGLNGAGKTTTIRMLLGMVKPTAGEARVLGEPIRRGTSKTCSQSTRPGTPSSACASRSMTATTSSRTCSAS